MTETETEPGTSTHQEIATTTAEITRGVLTAPAATHMIPPVIVPAGTTATPATHTLTREPAMAGMTVIQGVPMITPETTVEGDRSIKD